VFRHPRGLIPSPRNELAAATPYVHDETKLGPLPAVIMAWPKWLAYWGNRDFGDCVTAEEAGAKSVAGQGFFPNSTPIVWARKHGVLNGATPIQVLRLMAKSGFELDGKLYNDGPASSIDWTHATNLQSAIANIGPVKLGVAAENFETNPNGSVTGGLSGWAMYGYPAGLPEDHCVGLCGYSTTLDPMVAAFEQQGVSVSVPAGMPTGVCYAMYTWDSVGIVDEKSLQNMTYEAWVRNPVTVIAKPSAAKAA